MKVHHQLPLPLPPLPPPRRQPTAAGPAGVQPMSDAATGVAERDAGRRGTIARRSAAASPPAPDATGAEAGPSQPCAPGRLVDILA